LATVSQLTAPSVDSQITLSNCPAANISARTAQKTPLLLLFLYFAVQTCLSAKLLLSNDCCIFAYLAVVAQERVYMPQYVRTGKEEHKEEINVNKETKTKDDD
jgi:hypothetical protein